MRRSIEIAEMDFDTRRVTKRPDPARDDLSVSEPLHVKVSIGAGHVGATQGAVPAALAERALRDLTC